jgi:hypothetical protein
MFNKMVKVVKKLVLGHNYNKVVDGYTGLVKDIMDQYAVILKDEAIRKNVVNFIVDNEPALTKIQAQVAGLMESVQEMANERNSQLVNSMGEQFNSHKESFINNVNSSAERFNETVEEAYSETMREVEEEEAAN